jgi:hypothetical protein
MTVSPARRTVLAGMALLSLAAAGCAKKGELVVDSSVGVTALRTVCPSVGVPDYTGDVTLFSDPGRTDAGALDLVASLTNVRSQCSESTDKVYTAASFDVLARRSDTRDARRVELPYYATVLRGGSAVVSKRLGTVVIDFAAGQERARGTGRAAAYVSRAEATLPEDIRKKLTSKRKTGDETAAIDPLSEPDVRAALARASFELLIGFQLDERQLAYNATR